LRPARNLPRVPRETRVLRGHRGERGIKVLQGLRELKGSRGFQGPKARKEPRETRGPPGPKAPKGIKEFQGRRGLRERRETKARPDRKDNRARKEKQGDRVRRERQGLQARRDPKEIRAKPAHRAQRAKQALQAHKAPRGREKQVRPGRKVLLVQPEQPPQSAFTLSDRTPVTTTARSPAAQAKHWRLSPARVEAYLFRRKVRRRASRVVTARDQHWHSVCGNEGSERCAARLIGWRRRICFCKAPSFVARPTSALNRTLWNALLPCDRKIFERPDPPLNSDPSADAAERQ
jgi:hypothetical protein